MRVYNALLTLLPTRAFLSDARSNAFAIPRVLQYLAKPGSRPYCSAQPTGVDLPMTFLQGPEDVGRLPDAYWDKHAPRPGCTIGFPNEQIDLGEL